MIPVRVILIVKVVLMVSLLMIALLFLGGMKLMVPMGTAFPEQTARMLAISQVFHQIPLERDSRLIGSWGILDYRITTCLLVMVRSIQNLVGQRKLMVDHLNRKLVMPSGVDHTL
jgi:hypothetical protein